jgi:hypothetical protein
VRRERGAHFLPLGRVAPALDQLLEVGEDTRLLTSKGVAGVPRATLVIIAGTCGTFGLPGEAGVAMLLAVDEIMDMGRTTINVIGNALASVVVARWEGVFQEPSPASASPSVGIEVEARGAAHPHRPSPTQTVTAPPSC